MSSAVDIQIVNPPNLEKIEKFFKEDLYRETIEYSANYNQRLRVQRRLRLPFLDTQTGVAQNHSSLFVDKRLRMPGFRQGQLYSYPQARWRKTRRQYLNKMIRFPDRPFQSLRKDHETLLSTNNNNNNTSISSYSSSNTLNISGGMTAPTLGLISNESDLNGTLLDESSSLGAAGGDTSDSKDSQQHQQQMCNQPNQAQLKEDLPKEWFYEEMDNDVDSLEDPKSPADDEYDYDPRYGNKKRRKRKPGKRASLVPGEGTVRKRGAGRGRGAAISLESTLGEDVGLDGSSTAAPSTAGRKPKGTGTRGRKRTKGVINTNVHNSEPPSFESMAAAVGDLLQTPEEQADLRTYRKFI